MRFMMKTMLLCAAPRTTSADAVDVAHKQPLFPAGPIRLLLRGLIERITEMGRELGLRTN